LGNRFGTGIRLHPRYNARQLPEFHRRNRFVTLAFVICISGTHGDSHGPQIETSIETAQSPKTGEEIGQEGNKEGNKESQGQKSEAACQTRQSPPQGAAREANTAAGLFQQPVFVSSRPNKFTPRRFRREG
jgi:hypothetical protein